MRLAGFGVVAIASAAESLSCTTRSLSPAHPANAQQANNAVAQRNLLMPNGEAVPPVWQCDACWMEPRTSTAVDKRDDVRQRARRWVL